MKDNKPFGNEIAKKFNIGDLVKWQEWGQDMDGNFIRYLNFGMLVNIIHKHLGERDVVFASILPLDEKQTIEISISKLRKIQTN